MEPAVLEVEGADGEISEVVEAAPVLCRAIWASDVNAVKAYFVSRGPRTLSQTCLNNALEVSFSASNAAIANIILSEGAWISEMAVQNAISSSNPDLIELLVKHGWNPNSMIEGFTPAPALVDLCMSIECVKRLLELGANPNLRFPRMIPPNLRSSLKKTRRAVYVGEQSVFTAVGQQPVRPDVLQLLLDYGAELDREVLYPDFRIYPTGLRKRRVETIQFLVRAGLDINEVDEERGTPLHHSVEKGNVESVRLLIKAGADKNMIFFHRSFGKVSLLELADQLGNVESVRLLIKAGADKNMIFFHRSFGKVSSLELADQLGKADMIKALEKDETLEEDEALGENVEEVHLCI